jgi:hypothetical protein
MKERPILFSGAMVRALLDGSKTQTRRAVKLQVQHDDSWVGGWKIVHKRVTQALLTFNQLGGKPLGSEVAICPYGQPGDRLWVRETWLEDPEDDGTWAYTQYMGCKGSPLSDVPRKFQKPEHCIYREGWDGSSLRWRPSIHMPRWASRILLEIVSVRVERLQDISAADCHAEGIAQCDGIGSAAHMIDLASRMSGAPSIDVITYATLWEVINGLGSWDTNPWVWVVEFKRATAC